MPQYKVDQGLKHDLGKFCAFSEVLLIINMGIYVCKHRYVCTRSPKYDPIVPNKCTQNHQLCTNNTLDGGIALKIHISNLKYDSYITDTLYK